MPSFLTQFIFDSFIKIVIVNYQVKITLNAVFLKTNISATGGGEFIKNVGKCIKRESRVFQMLSVTTSFPPFSTRISES